MPCGVNNFDNRLTPSTSLCIRHSGDCNAPKGPQNPSNIWQPGDILCVHFKQPAINRNMRTHQTYLQKRSRIEFPSLSFTKRVASLGLWGKCLSLCVLSVLCVSAVGVAGSKSTTEIEQTLRPQGTLTVSALDQPPTIIILVRHAEKAIVPPENKDPDLSVAGLARAQELRRMFGDTGIAAIYATQFKRTQQTVKPLADKLRISVTQVEAKKTSDLVQQIRARNSGQVIFIAGHNNTVPEIIAALGGPQLPIIPETEFDNLYILTVQSDGAAQLLKMKYGSTLPASGQGMMKQSAVGSRQ
jgi:broad specificity phosphatase PhoE